MKTFLLAITALGVTAMAVPPTYSSVKGYVEQAASDKHSQLHPLLTLLGQEFKDHICDRETDPGWRASCFGLVGGEE
jgi:hypothetical protein